MKNEVALLRAFKKNEHKINLIQHNFNSIQERGRLK